MKSLILASLAFGFSASHAFSAELAAASKIDAVDLHPDSAEVTRIAHVSLPAGDTSIVLQGLSPHLFEQSLHVAGLENDGVSIRSVSLRREKPKTGVATPEEQALLDEQQELRGRIEALQTKQRMIRNLAEAPQTVMVAATGTTPAPDFWPTIWTKVADGLEETSRHLRETQKRLDVVTASLANMHSGNGRIQSAQTVVLDVTADHATDADLKLIYQVNGASWQPAYDARLRTDHQPAQLDMTRRARIEQNSGEDWTDVGLMLSTARLSATTKAPTLEETHDIVESGFAPRARMMAPAAPMAAKAAPPPPEAVVMTTAYDATLQMPGRVSVASGAPSKLYTIGSQTSDVELSVKSAPIVDKRAYLQAKYELKDRVPLIPGEAALYRDGTFVGRAPLEGAAEGDHVTLGFGADDLVSVERTDLNRKERNTTVDSGTASVERSFKTVVTNRHKFPIRVEIDDREPAFNNVAIVLKEAQSMTPPTGRDVDGHRGVLAWIDTYAPGEAKTINFAWKVRWPAKLGPIAGDEATQFFRFSGGTTF